MKLSAITSITNNIIAARFWMGLALLASGFAVAAPYLTIAAMKQKEKVVILDQGGTLIYAPLLGFEEAGHLHAYHVRLACLALLQRNPVGPDLPDLMKRLYLEEPARKKAAALYKSQNPEFKEKPNDQQAEVSSVPSDAETRHKPGFLRRIPSNAPHEWVFLARFHWPVKVFYFGKDFWILYRFWLFLLPSEHFHFQ